MKIAIAGKGGVGKTTIAANLIHELATNEYKVYAIDADPDTSLGLALGLSEEALDRAVPLIDLRDVIKEKMGDGAFYILNPQVSDVIENAAIVDGNIYFIRMGGIKEGGSACYCRENSFLHAVMDTLLLDKKDAVVLDMGAGIEHLTRGTSRGADLMLIVTEASAASIQTAHVIGKLSHELGIKNIQYIVNKVSGQKQHDFIKEHFSDKELLGIIPYQQEIMEASMEGKGIVEQTEGIFQKLFVSIINPRV